MATWVQAELALAPGSAVPGIHLANSRICQGCLYSVHFHAGVSCICKIVSAVFCFKIPESLVSFLKGACTLALERDLGICEHTWLSLRPKMYISLCIKLRRVGG